MIQRIQTIFLFLAAAASFAGLALPFATTGQPVAASRLFDDQTFTLMDNEILLAAFLLAGAIWLIDIFLFRNRPLQIRLAYIGILVLLFGIGLGASFFFRDPAVERAQVAIGVGLPIVALIAAILARNAIRKDEKLVRSADRLR